VGAYKPEERARARELRRRRGMPVKEIAAQVGVSVSTVSIWTRDIELTPKQRAKNERRACRRRAATWRRVNRERRRAHQEHGRARARDGDRLHQAGCMLYWAEGAKERNVVCFANSDVHMVRFFCRFLLECFRLEPSDIRLRLNVYTNNGIRIPEIERYWLDELDLPSSCLGKHILNHMPTSSSGRKKNKLPYGVCRVAVCRTDVVQHIYGAIQEYGGFEEPRWLDC
jgi:transposase-like protein